MKRYLTLLLLFFLLSQGKGVGQVPFLGPDIMVCPDQILVLDAGSGFSSYLWNTGSTNQSITITLAGLYWVEVTTGTGITMRDSVNVAYYPPMMPLTVITFNPICEQNNGTIIIDEPQELDYLYSIDGGLTFQEEEQFIGLAAGVYDIIVEDTNGCAELLMTVTLLLIPGPLIADIQTTPATNGQSNGTLTIHATGISLSYFINELPPQSSNYFTGLPAGVYSCSVTDIYGCVATSIANVEMIMNINNELTANRYFTVSPNPAKGIFRLILQDNASATELVVITDLQGRVVKEITSIEGKELQFDLTNHRAGMYVCKVVFKNGTSSLLIIKE